MPTSAPIVPCITLFTDASACPTHGIATWAAWAKYRTTDPTMRRSGVVRDENPRHLADMTFNEAYAISEGLREAWQLYAPPPGTLIVIQTDNDATAMLLRGEGKAKFRARYAHVYDSFAAFAAANGLRVTVRLVVGHKGTATPRNAVNTWCDRESRRLLKEERARKTMSGQKDTAA